MKKLLSVLLVMSTLFLTLNFQICFAKCDNYSSQNYEDNQKDVEIQKLKELLKEAENRNEKFEKEKQEKDIKQRLKEIEALKDQLEKEVKTKEQKSSPSLWSKIKSKFSFFFSSYVGIGAAAISFGTIVFGICYTAMAGYECSQDVDCHFFGGSEKGHSFFNQFEKVNFLKVFDLTKVILKNVMDIFHLFGVEDTTPGKGKN